MEKEKMENILLELKAAKEENEQRKNENRALKQKELSLMQQQKLMEEREEDLLLNMEKQLIEKSKVIDCLLYTSPSPRDLSTSRMPSSA